MRAKRHWTEMKRTWFVIWLLDFMLWLSLPVRYGDSKISLQLQEGGAPGKIIVTVLDMHKKPVPGIKVLSSSHSGTGPAAFTDATGRAIIDPAESEVTSLWVDGRGFDFENRFINLALRQLPLCENGLTIHATFKSR
ncbi:MAG: Ig-like domain-containing protein [Prosthecobacter sp.]|nr:Ig-like domain-containing protein [Prosthecobacter sp.]